MHHVLHHSADFIKKHNGLYIEHTIPEDNNEFYSCPYTMLIYIARGKGHYYALEQCSELSDGDILLINPNTPHKIWAQNTEPHLSMYSCSYFSDILPYTAKMYQSEFPELAAFFAGDVSYLNIKDTQQKDIRNFMIRILDDFTYSQPGYEYTTKALLTTVLIIIFRLYISEHNKKNPLNSNYIVGDVTNYINRNLYSKLSLSALAEDMHLTPQYLCNAFKKHTNMTFTEFANRMRVEKIKDELEHTDRPLFLIYANFDLSPQYINRIFKKYTGHNLSEYKKKYNYKMNNPLYKTQKERESK